MSALAQRIAAAVLLVLASGGCRTVSGASAPLTGRPALPSSGPVYVHTVSAPPEGLVMLGLVSAHGMGADATVDKVMPELIRQAQKVGATHLVVDALHMDYRWYNSYMSFTYQCGYFVCSGVEPTSHEVSTLLAQGRAFGPAPGPGPAPAPAPAAPSSSSSTPVPSGTLEGTP